MPKKEQVMKRDVAIACAVMLGVLSWPCAAHAALNPNPPASPVKLIFIHHSTGEAWLNDYHGELGLELRDNNYFVSDTNSGWGPDGIGDTTDIGHWWSWFSGPSRETYMSALYAESDQHCSYTRLETDPGGPNRIVMFKSCFPNSHLGGSISDPVPDIEDNPLRDQDAYSEYHTVPNARGIYIDLLDYFSQHPEKLFVAIAAPPLRSGDTSPEAAANARDFNNWLTNEWLVGYPLHNVFLFDFYNVLTSNGGSTRIDDPNVNDFGWADGNHHRLAAGAIEHMQTIPHNYLAYWTGDSHPSAAGDQKATGEYAPLLNVAYHCWNGDGDCPRWPSSTPLRVPYGDVPLTVTSDNHGVSVDLHWDASLCASTNYHIVWGYGSGLSTWQVEGGACNLGISGDYTWSGIPDPSGDSSRLLWFVITGDDGIDTEGSWGLTSSAAERGGAAASNVCGFSSKVTTGYCGTP
jgi:hypothetical protein